MHDFSSPNDQAKESDSRRGCHNCAHRFGLLRDFWKCGRTGFYTEVEMRFGGRCAEGKTGSKLLLWSPRPSFLRRVVSIVYQPAQAIASSQEGRKP
jgi:hypothetical protein